MKTLSNNCLERIPVENSQPNMYLFTDSPRLMGTIEPNISVGCVVVCQQPVLASEPPRPFIWLGDLFSCLFYLKTFFPTLCCIYLAWIAFIYVVSVYVSFLKERQCALQNVIVIVCYVPSLLGERIIWNKRSLLPSY